MMSDLSIVPLVGFEPTMGYTQTPLPAKEQENPLPIRIQRPCSGFVNVPLKARCMVFQIALLPL